MSKANQMRIVAETRQSVHVHYRQCSVSLDLPFGTLFQSLFDQYLALQLLSVILRHIFKTFFILAIKLLFLIVLTLVLPGRSGLL